MTTRHLQLTFPEQRVTEPVIYHMIKRFDVVPSIRRANITNHQGWLVIELVGDDASLDDELPPSDEPLELSLPPPLRPPLLP